MDNLKYKPLIDVNDLHNKPKKIKLTSFEYLIGFIILTLCFICMGF